MIRHQAGTWRREGCWAVVCGLALGMVFALGSVVLAQPLVEQETDESVERAREALSDTWGANWYDSANDGIARVNVVPPPPPKKPSNWNWNWLGNLFSNVGALIKWSVIALVILLFVGLCFWLAKSYYWRDRRLRSSDDEAEEIDPQAEIDRVEALPINIRRPRGNLLDEARHYYEQGDYDEAIVYLYSYFLVQLDLKQFIRLARGKTNRQYLRELRGDTPLRNLMENSMILFEDAFFGKRQLSRDQFEYAWNRLDEFHQRTKLPVTT